MLDVSVTYDTDKTERVRIGRVGDKRYGNRDGEQATGEVDVAAVQGVLDALEATLAPPAPATATDAPATPKP